MSFRFSKGGSPVGLSSLTVPSTKGGLLAGDGDGNPQELAVGSNNLPLVADSAQATGLKYSALPISSVTNLQTTLDGKAASSHTHAISDVTNLQTTLDGKAASSHTHGVGDLDQLAKGSLIAGDGDGAPRELIAGTNGQYLILDSSQAAGMKWGKEVKYLFYRLIDSETTLATATTVGGDHRITIPGTFVDTGAFLDAPGTTGTMIVDVLKNGTTIMTTNKINIASGQKSSEDGGATQPTITTTSYTAFDIITFNINAVHSTPGSGLTVWIAFLPS